MVLFYVIWDASTRLFREKNDEKHLYVFLPLLLTRTMFDANNLALLSAAEQYLHDVKYSTFNPFWIPWLNNKVLEMIYHLFCRWYDYSNLIYDVKTFLLYVSFIPLIGWYITCYYSEPGSLYIITLAYKICWVIGILPNFVHFILFVFTAQFSFFNWRVN